MHTLSDDETAKIKQFMKDGKAVLQEVEDLSGGLKDTAKAIAETLDIKPALLMKALKVAFKSKADDESDNFEIVDQLLIVSGEK
jgi:ABC-type iron transport system FetAB ATPase subunit